MKRIGIGALALLALLVTLGLLRNPQPANANGKDQGGKLSIRWGGTDAIVTLYKNGARIRTGDTAAGHSANWESLAPGDYELHVEAVGHKIKIIIVHVAAEEETAIAPGLDKGDGTEMLGEGPSLSELVSRIKKLEASTCTCPKK